MSVRPSLLALILAYVTASAAPFAAARADDAITNPACSPFVVTENLSRPMGGIICRSENPAAKNLLFIHGSPGNWKGWKRYLEDRPFADQFNIIAIDRPGFGVSGAGKPERNLRQQAQLVHQAAISQWGADAVYYVVGHSYGGPVAVQLALDFSHQVAGLLLLAPSLDPDLEKTEWYQSLADWQGVRWMVPTELDVTNQEIMALAPELDKQRERLSAITQPVLLVQGGKDGLVPPANADYAEKHLTAAHLDVTRLPEQNHFLPWLEYELVKQQILKLVTLPAVRPR